MKLTKIQFDRLTEKGLRPHQHSISGFSEACFNQNSAESIFNFDIEPVDSTDCKSWGIDAGQWREAQKMALECAMADYLESIE